MNDYEIIKGTLTHDPQTKQFKVLMSKVKIETEDFSINIVCWDDEAEKLSNMKKDDTIIVKGYRKYNDFLNKEEFNVIQIIKRN